MSVAGNEGGAGAKQDMTMNTLASLESPPIAISDSDTHEYMYYTFFCKSSISYLISLYDA